MAKRMSLSKYVSSPEYAAKILIDTGMTKERILQKIIENNSFVLNSDRLDEELALQYYDRFNTTRDL